MAEAKEKKPKVKEPSEWDKRKIIFFSLLTIILLILGYSLKNSVLGESGQKSFTTQNNKSITPNIDIRKNVSDQIESLKQEAGKIDLVDVATSSPQVQKVINDLKALKDYPNNQVKQACVNICSKL